MAMAKEVDVGEVPPAGYDRTAFMAVTIFSACTISSG
jgi:hypothetical protein